MKDNPMRDLNFYLLSCWRKKCSVDENWVDIILFDYTLLESIELGIIVGFFFREKKDPEKTYISAVIKSLI